MKDIILINQTDSEVLNILISSISHEFLEEVRNRQYEIDGSVIAKTHAEVIRKMMPRVFCMLLNHFELLKILSKCELTSKEEKTIQIASKFLKDIMLTFINHIIVFGDLTIMMKNQI